MAPYKLSVEYGGMQFTSEGDTFFEAEAALRHLVPALDPLAIPDDDRDPGFYDLSRFQAAVKEWAYRNFGSPDDGRTIRLNRFFEAMQRVASGEVEFSQGRLASLVESVLDAPPDAPSYRPLIGAVEELGELAHAHLKGEQGIRHTPEEITDKKLDAMGDVFVYLADYANREGLGLYEAVARAWGEVRQRDWTMNSTTGRTSA